MSIEESDKIGYQCLARELILVATACLVKIVILVLILAIALPLYSGLFLKTRGGDDRVIRMHNELRWRFKELKKDEAIAYAKAFVLQDESALNAIDEKMMLMAYRSSKDLLFDRQGKPVTFWAPDDASILSFHFQKRDGALFAMRKPRLSYHVMVWE